LNIRSLKTTNFRSLQQATLDFVPGINLFYGLNGTGKTNILDAIHYLCLTKSYFTNQDSQVKNHETDFFRLEAQFSELEISSKLVIKVEPGISKVIEWNGKALEKLALHIGRVPVVMIEPDDTRLVTEGSELRRRFLDYSLSQLNPIYLKSLSSYNNLLQQRNSFLKSCSSNLENGVISLLETYDKQMQQFAEYIYFERSKFMQRFNIIISQKYEQISSSAEELTSKYVSELQNYSWQELKANNLRKDFLLRRTTAGPHKDDLEFELDGTMAKRYASQGQLKSVSLALKLAQYEIMKEQLGKSPIFLLDDLFDKLDPSRVEQLLTIITSDSFGQIFISDTQEDRTSKIMSKLEKSGLSIAKFALPLIREK
jgi:DNA replication and repair protein RecF